MATYFAIFHGYIVTANQDGSIPINAKQVAKLDEDELQIHGPLLDQLIKAANAWAAQEKS